MANDTLKNRVRFSTTLEPDVNEQLKQMSRETLIPISKLVNIAITNLLKEGINVSPKSITR